MMIALAMLAIAGISWVSVGIVAEDRWPIRWLEVNGAFQRVSAEQLRASLQPLISSSFFTADLGELRDAANKISWVSRVSVQKKWPDTVSVLIEEYLPIAHWNRGQLISNQSVAFTVPEADGIQGLPWLRGPPEQLEKVLENWARFNIALGPTGLEIEELAVDRRGAWAMVLNNGTRVQMGRDSEMERLERLLRSWPLLLQEHAMAPMDVDLRYTNGIAVLWPQAPEKLAGMNN
jgi:cell division protein FtsQ